MQEQRINKMIQRIPATTNTSPLRHRAHLQVIPSGSQSRRTNASRDRLPRPTPDLEYGALELQKHGFDPIVIKESTT